MIRSLVLLALLALAIVTAVEASAAGPVNTAGGGIAQARVNPAWQIGQDGTAHFANLDPSSLAAGMRLDALVAAVNNAMPSARFTDGSGNYIGPIAGNISRAVATATGMGTAATAADRASRHLDVLSDMGAVADNVHDDAAAINVATATLANGGDVYVPPGTYRFASTLLMRPNLRLHFDFGAKVYCATAGSPCIGQDATVALIGAAIDGAHFFPASSAEDADPVIVLPAISHSEIAHNFFDGFNTSPSLISLGGTASPVSNILWLNVHDNTGYGCSTCILLQGAFGSNGQPNQVLTANSFANNNFLTVTGRCIDIRNSADTNVFFGGLCNLVSDGAIGVAQGLDPARPGQYNYVNSNKFWGIAFSHTNASAFSFFSAGYFVYATEAEGVETDVDSAQHGTATASISGTTLTVSSMVDDGTFAVGDSVTGTGIAANTVITALGSGTGGVGTYQIVQLQTVASTTLSSANWQATGSIAGSVMTIAAKPAPTGNIAVGDAVSGTEVLSGTVIQALGSGTGGAGTYILAQPQTVASTTVYARTRIIPIDMGQAKSYRICGKHLDWSDQTAIGCQTKGEAWHQMMVAPAAAAGGSYTIPFGFDSIVFSGAADADGFSVVLPVSPPDGTVIRLTTTGQTITSVSWPTGPSGPSATTYGVPTTISAAAPVALQYIANSNSWVHVAG